MVLFDKGGHILKSTEFHKEKKEWLYQLKNAAELADRAEAAQALAKLKSDEDAVAALRRRVEYRPGVGSSRCCRGRSRAHRQPCGGQAITLRIGGQRAAVTSEIILSLHSAP